MAFKELKITAQQRAWLDEFLRTGNATASAFKAYNCSNTNSAAALGARMKKMLANPILLYMEANGWGLREMVQVVSEGLKATRFEKAGPVTYEDRPDHAVREKYLRHLQKLLDIKPPSDVDVEEGDQRIVVNFYEPSLKRGAKGRWKMEKYQEPQETTEIEDLEE